MRTANRGKYRDLFTKSKRIKTGQTLTLCPSALLLPPPPPSYGPHAQLLPPPPSSSGPRATPVSLSSHFRASRRWRSPLPLLPVCRRCDPSAPSQCGSATPPLSARVAAPPLPLSLLRCVAAPSSHRRTRQRCRPLPHLGRLRSGIPGTGPVTTKEEMAFRRPTTGYPSFPCQASGPRATRRRGGEAATWLPRTAATLPRNGMACADGGHIAQIVEWRRRLGAISIRL